MTCTILMENHGDFLFYKEHGLSFYLEVADKRVLLDGGSSGKFTQNAKELNISLPDVDFAVLSHGHYDHSDGFSAFFQENTTAPLYVRREAFAPYFSFTSGTPKYVGIHKRLQGEESQVQQRYRPVADPVTALSPSLYLVGQPDCKSPEGSTVIRAKQEGLYQVKRGWDDFVPDTFSHQQSLVVLEETQLVIFNSCCHGDVVAIIDQILTLFPHYHRFSLVGGLHLPVTHCGTILFDQNEVQNLGKALKDRGLVTLLTGHCTSPLAVQLLEESLQEQIQCMKIGQRHTFV